MGPMRPPYVKICCIGNLAEARLARAAGAAALGLVSAMPSGPGVVADDTIAAILQGLQADALLGQAAPHTFLLTALRDAEALAEQHQRLSSSHIQLVDAVPHAELRRLRALRPQAQLVQVIHVTGPESLAEALALQPDASPGPSLVDLLLLDSGRPLAAQKELGGTGRVHDWAISRQIVAASRLPVLLAGGLRVDNLAEAIAQVRPQGLDLCSSVRTGVRRQASAEGPASSGALDADLLAAFMRQAGAALPAA
jgi:phosphoribosylanthranilate isomerase